MVNVIPKVLILAVPHMDTVDIQMTIANVKAALIFESQIRVIVSYVTFAITHLTWFFLGFQNVVFL